MRNRSLHTRIRLLVFLPIAVAVSLLVGIVVLHTEPSAVAQDDSLKPLEQPPEGQTYMGTAQCAACHFNQYLVWQKTKHAEGFKILPDKYKTNADCLKCHTTGHGEASGYKDASTKSLEGTSCEACHGPGSKHGEIAKGFAGKKLTDAQEAYVRSTIHKILPSNACIKCHLGKAHKAHPPYDKT